jgi:hypothetical protein
MDQVVHNMSILDEVTNTVEIVVHVSENLEVRYDANMYSSQDLLASVRSQNVNARLMARYNW